MIVAFQMISMIVIALRVGSLIMGAGSSKNKLDIHLCEDLPIKAGQIPPDNSLFNVPFIINGNCYFEPFHLPRIKIF